MRNQMSYALEYHYLRSNYFTVHKCPHRVVKQRRRINFIIAKYQLSAHLELAESGIYSFTLISQLDNGFIEEARLKIF